MESKFIPHNPIHLLGLTLCHVLQMHSGKITQNPQNTPSLAKQLYMFYARFESLSAPYLDPHLWGRKFPSLKQRWTALLSWVRLMSAALVVASTTIRQLARMVSWDSLKVCSKPTFQGVLKYISPVSLLQNCSQYHCYHHEYWLYHFWGKVIKRKCSVSRTCSSSLVAICPGIISNYSYYSWHIV